MCVAGLAPILGLFGTVVQAAGQAQQAEAQAQQAEYKAKQDRLLAEDAIKRGAQEEQKQRYQTKALLGRQRAVQAAGNLDLSSGSPLAVMSDTAALGEWDAQIIRDNASREKQYYTTQAHLGDSEASNARAAGGWAAFGTVLGGMQSLSKSFYNTRYA